MLQTVQLTTTLPRLTVRLHHKNANISTSSKTWLICPGLSLGPTADNYSPFLNLLLLLMCSIHSSYPLAFSMWFRLLKFSFCFSRKIFKLVFKLDHLLGFVMSCLFLSVFVGSCNCGQQGFYA